LFAAGNELSQSDISRGFLLNGLFIIYLGPVLTKYVAGKLGDARGMIVSMLIAIGALGTFMLFGTIPAAFAAVILLGIAESFGVSMKTTYFLNLKGIKEMEINKGIAFFSIMVNFSRMLGPIVFGLALSLGARMGVGLISLVLLMLLLVFIFSASFKPAPVNAAG
jgi:predicted MFS family arabinose efflux permease